MLESDTLRITRALISVSDKAGLLTHAQALRARDVRLVSTGGTFATLQAAGIAVEEVAALTGFPEILDGRVKTLHPAVHAGLLARRDESTHQAAMAAHGLAAFDLLYVNLYPFEQTLAAGKPFKDCLENIDVGGPAMLRAAAKNHAFIAVASDEEDMALILEDMRASGGCVSPILRARLAAKAFARTAAYDSAIANWLAGQFGDTAPKWRSFAGRKLQDLRYGENPHQSGAFYADGTQRLGIASARQIQGKDLSFNNLADTDAAIELVAEFTPKHSAAAVIIKHANPCGVALGEDVLEAYTRALACDAVSAFGGVVAVNRRLDRAAAEKIIEIFTEVVVAPDADDEAIAVFAAKKNLRLLLTGGLPDPAAPGQTVRSVAGGFLVQERDGAILKPEDLQVVTQRAPSPDEMADLLFAFTVCKHVKSNAIVYAKAGQTLGIGAGQMNRRDSARIAALRAQEAGEALGLGAGFTSGCVCASDAFFPFADGLIHAAQAGAKAVIQPGGSIRDKEVIAAADAAGLAMVFTGMRHFRH